MRIARFGTVLLAGMIALGTALPAEAATTTINAISRTQPFSPQVVTKPQGTTFAWHNSDSTFTHTSTQDDPLDLWDTGNIAPGVTKTDSPDSTINFAGAYPYHCSFHPTTMVGTVRIPIKVNATSGTTSDTFTISMATVDASGNLVYDVQRRVGSGAWTAFKTGITAKSVTFKASATGTYSFRSRVRDKTVAGKFSGWSPRKTITIT